MSSGLTVQRADQWRSLPTVKRSPQTIRRAIDKAHADFYDFAKMLYVFDDVVKNAQPIEAHTDKYVETKRENKNLKQTFILLSAFKDDDFIIPIEFNIKEYNDNTKSKLYVSVTLQKIEVDLMGTPSEQSSYRIPKPTSIYSITEIIKNVNTQDKYFLKYLPDSMLSTEQIVAKNEALEEDRIRLDDTVNHFSATEEKIAKAYDNAASFIDDELALEDLLKYADAASRLNEHYRGRGMQAGKLYRNTAGEIEAFDTGRRTDLTAEQRKNTRPDIDRSDVVIEDNIAVSYLAKDEYDEEIANIKPQLRHAQEKLNALEIVFSGRIDKKFTRKEDMKKWAKSELKQYGFSVDRQGFGKILFPERAIDDAIGHIKDQEEILPIIALFRVLKRGVQIAEHGDHKKRQKHTVTIAAPIEINGVRGNMGVVVNLTNNKYYVHRVIMPDGSSFKFDIKKDTSQEMRKGVPEGSLADATRLASTNSIPQNSEKSTENAEKNSGSEGKASRAVGESSEFFEAAVRRAERAELERLEVSELIDKLQESEKKAQELEAQAQAVQDAAKTGKDGRAKKKHPT